MRNFVQNWFHTDSKFRAKKSFRAKIRKFCTRNPNSVPYYLNTTVSVSNVIYTIYLNDDNIWSPLHI